MKQPINLVTYKKRKYRKYGSNESYFFYIMNIKGVNMATLINEAELKEKCEKATEYGLKRSGRIRFKTKP